MNIEERFEEAVNEGIKYRSAETVAKGIMAIEEAGGIQEIFKWITEEEKKGFSDEEIRLSDISFYNEEVYIYFQLPTYRDIERKIKTKNVIGMDKEEYERYKQILNDVVKKKEELKKKREEAKKREEEEEKKKEIERKIKKYEEMQEQFKKCREENEKLKTIIAKYCEKQTIDINEEEIREKELINKIIKEYREDC